MAVLLKHCDLGYVVLSLVEHSQMEITGKQNMPKSLSELCRVVCQTKRSLIKVTDAKKKKRTCSDFVSLHTFFVVLKS